MIASYVWFYLMCLVFSGLMDSVFTRKTFYQAMKDDVYGLGVFTLILFMADVWFEWGWIYNGQ